jgi:predicted signal transduction protein with EAL and GGDEF domain
VAISVAIERWSDDCFISLTIRQWVNWLIRFIDVYTRSIVVFSVILSLLASLVIVSLRSASFKLTFRIIFSSLFAIRC